MKESKNKEILSVYEKGIPSFLIPYLSLESMKRISHVGMHCGMEYTSFPFYRDLGSYSRYFHSLGVALIVYHFRKDRKEALSGLFHDVATPCFAHVIDFLNKDYTKQESTEAKTEELLKNDKDLLPLLEKDNLTIDDIKDYHRYPIADNDTPKLSADRLEYTLSNLMNFSFASIQEVKDFYDDLIISNNEEGERELCFLSPEKAIRFTLLTLKNSAMYVSDEDRFGMEILARILSKAKKNGIIQEADFYSTEEEIIEKLKADPFSAKDFALFTNLHKILSSPTEKEGYLKIPSKKRYIDPYVVSIGRVSSFSSEAKEAIDSFLARSFDNYLSTETFDSFSFHK